MICILYTYIYIQPFKCIVIKGNKSLKILLIFKTSCMSIDQITMLSSSCIISILINNIYVYNIDINYNFSHTYMQYIYMYICIACMYQIYYVNTKILIAVQQILLFSFLFLLFLFEIKFRSRLFFISKVLKKITCKQYRLIGFVFQDTKNKNI